MNAHSLAPWSARVWQHPLSARPKAETWTGGQDRRWREVVAALDALRADGRHAVRIVDADCGMGLFLLHTVHHARSLGFTAIEGRGIDGSPALIACARAAAFCYADPAVGLAYEVADAVEALREEAEAPADIVLWHGPRLRDRGDETIGALREAGDVVVADHFTCRRMLPS